MGLTGLTGLMNLTDLTGLISLKDLIYSRDLSLGCSSFLPITILAVAKGILLF